MTFKNLKKKVKNPLESFSVAQLNTLCDLYADPSTNGSRGIKHGMLSSVPAGNQFEHLLQPAIQTMLDVEESARVLTGGETVSTEQQLRQALLNEYVTYDPGAMQHLVSAIVDATGTWTEYVTAAIESMSDAQ